MLAKKCTTGAARCTVLYLVPFPTMRWRATALAAVASMCAVAEVRCKMYYDVPPYTQLDTVFELWQGEQIDEGHQVSRVRFSVKSRVGEERAAAAAVVAAAEVAAAVATTTTATAMHLRHLHSCLSPTFTPLSSLSRKHSGSSSKCRPVTVLLSRTPCGSLSSRQYCGHV